MGSLSSTAAAGAAPALELALPAPPRQRAVPASRALDPGRPKPRNPRHFATIEDGRVRQALLVTLQSVNAMLEFTVAKPLFRTRFGVQAVSETRLCLHFDGLKRLRD